MLRVRIPKGTAVLVSCILAYAACTGIIGGRDLALSIPTGQSHFESGSGAFSSVPIERSEEPAFGAVRSTDLGNEFLPSKNRLELIPMKLSQAVLDMFMNTDTKIVVATAATPLIPPTARVFGRWLLRDTASLPNTNPTTWVYFVSSLCWHLCLAFSTRLHRSIAFVSLRTARMCTSKAAECYATNALTFLFLSAAFLALVLTSFAITYGLGVLLPAFIRFSVKRPVATTVLIFLTYCSLMCLWETYLLVFPQKVHVQYFMYGRHSHPEDSGGTTKVPPAWSPEMEHHLSFRHWMMELSIWCSCTELPPERRGGAVVMRLGGVARIMARQIPTEVLQNGYPQQGISGVAVIVRLLAGKYAPLEEETQMRAISDFLGFRRMPGEAVHSLLARWELLRFRAEGEGGFALNPSGCAWMLLNATGIPQE